MIALSLPEIPWPQGWPTVSLPDQVDFTTVAASGGGAVIVILLLLLRGRVNRRRHQRAIEELQHSTVHVTTIVDSALDAIVAMDGDGRITQWNPQAEKLFGWDAEDVYGRKVSETIIPERLRLEHEKGLSHFHRTGKGAMLGKVMEVSGLRRDGTEVPVDLSINLGVRDGDRVTFVAFVRDASARQRSERLQGVRFVVAGVLSEARAPAEATLGVLTAIGTRIHAPMTALWTPTLGGLGSEQQWASAPAEVAPLLRATQSATMPVDSGLPGRVWSLARPLTLAEVPNGHEDVDRLRLAAEAGLHNAVAVPVSSGDKVLAVIEIFTRVPEDIDEEMLRTLDDIGLQLGQYLARHRAEALHESPEQLRALLENAGEAIITVAEDGAITALNDRARRLFGYTSLEVLGEDLRVLLAESSRDLLIEYVSETIERAHGGPPVRRWCDVTGRRKDAGLFDVALHITPLTVGGRQLFMCIAGEPPGAVRHSDAGEFRVYRGGDAEQHPRLA